MISTRVSAANPNSSLASWTEDELPNSAPGGRVTAAVNSECRRVLQPGIFAVPLYPGCVRLTPNPACDDRLMIEVLADTLPFAVALLLSPSPIIAALLILLSPSGTAGGVTYGLGRLVGVAVVAILVSLLIDVITIESGSTLVSASLRMALGVALLGFAVVKWLRRPKPSDHVVLPKWMASVEGMSPTGAAGLGFLLPVANPKELALTIGAGLTIGAAGLSRAATVSLALCYTVIACLTVIVPIAAFVVDRDRMVGPLGRARSWLVQNNDTIMIVVFVVIGSMLIGAGVGQL
jgi:threonine/homoserine/homoserine lactone efflux protein